MALSTLHTFPAKFEVVDSTKQLLLCVVQSLVSRPDHATIESWPKDGILLIVITVAAEDLHVVLGKDGRTARSLRAVASAIASSSKQRMELEVHAEGQAGA